MNLTVAHNEIAELKKEVKHLSEELSTLQQTMGNQEQHSQIYQSRTEQMSAQIREKNTQISHLIEEIEVHKTYFILKF